MKDTDIIRVLVLNGSLNEAEALVSTMRNAGFAVRATQVGTWEAVEEAIEEKAWDLLLTRDTVNDGDAPTILNLLQERQRDIPVIIITDQPDCERLTEGLRAGAAMVLGPDQGELLQITAARELERLNERRAHRRCRSALRESEKRCRTLLDHSRDAISYVHDGMHIYANPVYLELFGYESAEELEGLPVMDLVASEDQGDFKNFLRNQATEGVRGQVFEFHGMRADGGEFEAVMEFSEASVEGEPCTQIIIRTRRGDTNLEEKLRELSRRDLLTGLLNRDAFMEALNGALDRAAAASGERFALLYLELDHLPEIARSVGLAGADVVLNDVATLLRRQVDEAVTALSRYGDSSFALLLPDVGAEQARATAEAMRKVVAEHIVDVTGRSVTTTCSVGVAPVGDQLQNAQQTLDQAHNACDRASRGGGNGVEVYTPRVVSEEAAAEEDRLVAQLRQALEEDSYTLMYQPIVSLHGDPKEYYQALLRLTDPDGTLVPAGRFMAAAERHGLTGAIDRWVIQRAAKVIGEQHRAGSQTHLFLVLSQESVLDEDFGPWLSNVIKEARIGGDCLVFELNADVAATYLQPARQLVRQLSALHCQVALTHFGTGLNPFALLKHLEVGFLKLDPSFIQNLSHSPDNQEALRTLVSEAHAHGKLVIAPKVEEAANIAILWQCAVNFTQGNYLQEPSEWLSYDFHGEGV